MKTFILLFSIVTISCSCQKKEMYTCNCTSTHINLFGGDPVITHDSYKIYNKQRKAEHECRDHEGGGLLKNTSCSLSK